MNYFFARKKFRRKFASMLDVFSNPEICFKRELFGHGKNHDYDGKNGSANSESGIAEAKNDISTGGDGSSNSQKPNIASDKKNEIVKRNTPNGTPVPE